MSQTSQAEPGKNDVQAILDNINCELAGADTLLLLQDIDPEMAGFPVHTKRLAIVGGRADAVTDDVLGGCVQMLVDNPLRARYSWRQILGRDEKSIN